MIKQQECDSQGTTQTFERKTYYYSTFQLFADQQQVDVLLNYQSFKNKLRKRLGDIWRIEAQLLPKDPEATPFQLMLVCWLQTKKPFFRYKEAPNYDNDVFKSFELKLCYHFKQRSLEADHAKLYPLALSFFITANQTWEYLFPDKPASKGSVLSAIFKRISSTLKISEENLLRFKPMGVAREVVMRHMTSQESQKALINGLEQIDLSKTLKPFQSFKAKWAQTQKSEATLQFQPMGAFDPFRLFSSAYEYILRIMQGSRHKWQIARGFVYSISQVNSDFIKKYASEKIDQNFKVRILQPASDFYQSLIVIWLLFKEKNLDFSAYSAKVKSIFGEKWSEKLAQPVRNFYEVVWQEWHHQQHESTESFVARVRMVLKQRWEASMQLGDQKRQ